MSNEPTNDELFPELETGLIEATEEHNKRYFIERFEQLCETMEIPTFRFGLRNYLRYMRENNLLGTLFDSVDGFRESSRKYFEARRKAGITEVTLNSEKSAIRRAVREMAGSDLNMLKMINEIFSEKSKAKNPFKTTGVDPFVQKSNIVSPDELKKLIHGCLHPETRPGYENLHGNGKKPWLKEALWIRFLYNTAARVGEMVSIRLSDMEPFNGHFHIKLQQTKTGKTQYLPPVPKGLIQEIMACFKGTVFLFETRGKSHKPVTREYVAQRIKKVSETILGRAVHPHSFRHSAITLFYQQTHDIKKTQMFARHANAATTIGMYVDENPTEDDYQTFHDALKTEEEQKNFWDYVEVDETE